MIGRPAPSPLPRACPHRRLARLLAAQLPARALDDGSTLRPWASASFVGARHQFRCTDSEAETVDELRHRLSTIEWRLPGHIVADVAVESDASGLQIEILTVED